jgi:hypothetical protein
VLEWACASSEDEAVKWTADKRDEGQGQKEDEFEAEAEGEGGVDCGLDGRAELLDGISALCYYDASVGDKFRETFMYEDLGKLSVRQAPT